MRLFWNWVLYKLCCWRWSYRWLPESVQIQNAIYCPKCGGCGYWECCMPCRGGLFCAGLYNEKDKQDWFRNEINQDPGDGN